MIRLNSWVVASLFLGVTAYAIAEEITLTTYYPSPRGVYDQLRTAGDVQIGNIEPSGLDPVPRLHIVQGHVAPALRIDDESPAGTIYDSTPFVVDQDGNVGIGLAGPQAKLDVGGGIKVGKATTGSAGTLQWDGTKLQVFQDPPAPGQWVDVATGGGPSGSGTLNRVAKWTGASALGDSLIKDDGVDISMKSTQEIGTAAGLFVGVTGNWGGRGTGMEIEKVPGPGGNPATALHLRTDNYDDGVRRMTITRTGEVGIGTSSPSKKLEVAGNIGATQVCIGSGCRSKWGAQLTNVPIATLTAQHRDCTAATIASASSWWLPCQAACNRHCQSQGFIGGSLVEYDPSLGANCLCTQ